jgi:prepilin-type N-terminal cleavage/methylation domain-containing protein/prepilin-type processing-associated H-X9-DG protein
MTPARRRGFTLIELLVVMAIIGVLVGLLLPAVQAAREQARRLQCANNLKQIGLALANYIDRNQGLPAGYRSTWDLVSQREIGPGWGWAAKILPVLDQQPLYDAINLDQNIQDPVNQTARLTKLSVYLCPSDVEVSEWTAANGVLWIYQGHLYSAQQPICDIAMANYVGVFGIGEPGVDGEGIFFRDSFIKPVDITDGLSHTLAVGERATNLAANFGTVINVGPPLKNVGRGQATWVGAVAGALLWSCAPDPFDPDSGTCKREDGSGMALGHTGEGHGPGDTRSDVNQFTSRHLQGAHFVFCDGHVTYLRLGMEYNAYKALSTRAGGELIPNDY